MNALRPIKTIEVFYEYDGPFAAPKAVAEQTFRFAADVVGRHAGPIAISNVRGVRLNGAANPLKFNEIPLGDAPHTALLTGRRVAGGEVTNALGANRTRIDGKGKIVSTRCAVTYRPPHEDLTGGQRLGNATHELAHGLGLDHCDNKACIMRPVHEVAAGGLSAVMASRQPFCEPCAGDLEVAGYMAVAAQLN